MKPKRTEQEVGELQGQMGDKLWSEFDAGKESFANLIEAAPEMLELLESILKGCREAYVAGNMASAYDIPELKTAFSKLSFTIAKARGET